MPRPRLYLVRHGETDWNAEGRLLSRTDLPLNELGRRQAATLAAGLADVAWDRVYASPLLRAVQTAAILVSGNSGAPPVQLDGLLVEMDFGPYEGWSEAELEADTVAAARRRDGAALPGVETEASVEARARSFLDGIADLSGATLVVGHGRMLRILIATVVLRLPTGAASAMRMRNCRPAIVEPGSRPLLLGLNVGHPADEACRA